MRLLITGICGFVGSTLAREMRMADSRLDIVGIDNLSRPGSDLNRAPLAAMGIRVFHGDVRSREDIAAAGTVDWIVDASANPSVLAGLASAGGSRQLLDTNLGSTINLLEYARDCQAGFILLSTSRVYSIPPLAAVQVERIGRAYRPLAGQEFPPGLSAQGISEEFSTHPPLSLYGASKLASEIIALEYHHAFGLPVWINRCGVLAGAGQFGRPDQGIVAYWLNAWKREKPLKYIGFDGLGSQVRDIFHPRDLVPVLTAQMNGAAASTSRLCHFGGGLENACSLADLSAWCRDRWGERPIHADPQPRPFDLPWIVLDTSRAMAAWRWRPATPALSILEEVATHAESHPQWLRISGVE